MHRFSRISLTAALLGTIIYICSCAGGGMIDATDPITPAPELSEGTVDPATRAITITKEGITVTVEHWSRTRLNRKYTTVDMRSPFFYLETWPQSFQSDVFEVTIKNDTPKKLILNLKETRLEDEREYKYSPLGIEELKYKFVTKKYMDLRTKKGLELARSIILNEALGPQKVIPAGKTVSGFMVFTVPSSQAVKVWLVITLEKEPESATAAYERVQFRFDYVQDVVLRRNQPPVKR